MHADIGIALDCLALVNVVVLYFLSGRRSLRSGQCLIYSRMVLVLAAFLITDIYYLSLQSSYFPQNHTALFLSKNFYFILNSLIVFIWAQYASYSVYGIRYKEKRIFIAYKALFAANIILVAFSIFTGRMFSISDSGAFVANEPMMWFFTLINYASVAVSVVMLVVKRKKLHSDDIYLMVLFPVMPLLAEIFQLFFGKYFLICSYTVSALIIFQTTQNSEIYTDDLTGISNRRLLNEYLAKWLDGISDDTVCGIMIDLDGLKNINDTYGHRAGDNALLSMAEILKSIKCRRLHPIRYGGDEFLLVWTARNDNDIPIVLDELYAYRDRVNEGKPPAEHISFSCGSYSCKANDGTTTKDFIRLVDAEMYKSKEKAKKASV